MVFASALRSWVWTKCFPGAVLPPQPQKHQPVGSGSVTKSPVFMLLNLPTLTIQCSVDHSRRARLNVDAGCSCWRGTGLLGSRILEGRRGGKSTSLVGFH